MRILCGISLLLFFSCTLCSADINLDQTKLNKNDLILLLAEEVRASESAMAVVWDILNSSYESKKRPVKFAGGNSLMGSVYPIQPEILGDIMQRAKGKRVLEIAAANGDSAILIGLAGAKEVYVNDIAEIELAEFEKKIARLPDQFRSKFKIIFGDCLKVFDKSYYEKFDIIYARNIFHFFVGEKREIFIKTFEDLLDIDGRLIITVNSPDEFFAKMISINPDAYVFKHETFLLRAPNKNSTIMFTDIDIENNLSGVDPLQFSWTPMIKFLLPGPMFYPIFYSLPDSTQKRLLSYSVDKINSQSAVRLAMEQCTIDCHAINSVLYRENTIRKAFADSKLRFIESSCIDENGHKSSRKLDYFMSAVFVKNIR